MILADDGEEDEGEEETPAAGGGKSGKSGGGKSGGGKSGGGKSADGKSAGGKSVGGRSSGGKSAGDKSNNAKSNNAKSGGGKSGGKSNNGKSNGKSGGGKFRVETAAGGARRAAGAASPSSPFVPGNEQERELELCEGLNASGAKRSREIAKLAKCVHPGTPRLAGPPLRGPAPSVPFSMRVCANRLRGRYEQFKKQQRLHPEYAGV